MKLKLVNLGTGLKENEKIRKSRWCVRIKCQHVGEAFILSRHKHCLTTSDSAQPWCHPNHLIAVYLHVWHVSMEGLCCGSGEPFFSSFFFFLFPFSSPQFPSGDSLRTKVDCHISLVSNLIFIFLLLFLLFFFNFIFQYWIGRELRFVIFFLFVIY
jgi:hypothetical protein